MITARVRTVLGRCRPTDVLLPTSIVLWAVAVRSVDTTAMNDWGLFPVLPVVFFAAVVLLVLSIVVALTDADLSPVRLGLHLVAFVFVLQGTMPMIFAAPSYSWAYKHMGVVGYINLHGALNPRIDIYQNWPGFFSLAAWFTKIAGVHSPLAYAAWAPVYFNLLICLELHFAFRSLPIGRRVRWFSSFLFVAGNWLGQDYFAPQAMAYVLSLAVLAMILAWLQTDQLAMPVRAVRRFARWVVRARNSDEYHVPEAVAWPVRRRVAALISVLAVFSAVTVTHQLSPYMVILGVVLITAAGMVRPRWVVVGLLAIAIGYLVPHLAFVQRTQHLTDGMGPDALINFLKSPFNYLQGRTGGSVAEPGRQINALAAPALMLGMWGLGVFGAARRLRAGRATLMFGLLAIAPALISFGETYGVEALLRIYFFSLPWTALLAASLLEPRSERWRRTTGLGVGLMLVAVVTLFMSAFFGAQELHQLSPGAVQASQYFYDHAKSGSSLAVITPNFPLAVGDRYDRFPVPRELTGLKDEPHIPAQRDVGTAMEFAASSGKPVYLALSTDEQSWGEAFGLIPKGSLAELDRTLAASTDWQLFYRNHDAVIYRFPRTAAAVPDRHDGATSPPVEPRLHLMELVASLIGLIGLGLAAAAYRRRSSQGAVLGRKMTLDDLASTDAVARAATVEVLGVRGGPEAVRGLVSALVDPQPQIRRRAAHHLGRSTAQAISESSASDPAEDDLVPVPPDLGSVPSAASPIIGRSHRCWEE